jgi:hypothetical protein
VSARDQTLVEEIQREALSREVPLSDTLRKVITLGGKVGSSELRDWASRELRGYPGSEELPDYRRPRAIIQIDAFLPGGWITGQQISPRALPEGVREHVDEEVPLRHSIGEIEGLLDLARKEEGHVKLTLPGSQDVAALMNHAAGQPGQHINRVYWTVSEAAIYGVIDQVRTTLVELMAEITAATPEKAEEPSAKVADQAVNFVVKGIGARVNVNTAQTTDGSTQLVGEATPVAGHAWSWRVIGAAAVGVATIIGVILQWKLS